MEMDYKWLSEEVLAVDNLAPANIITASTYTFGMLYAKAILRLLSLLGAKEGAKHTEGFVRAEYYLNPKYKHAIDYHLKYLVRIGYFKYEGIVEMPDFYECCYYNGNTYTFYVDYSDDNPDPTGSSSDISFSVILFWEQLYNCLCREFEEVRRMR